jgi:DNA-binding LytR/AlgR family response regulator
MNCIIIDDDKLTQTLIQSFINKSELLSCKGTFSNPLEASSVITKQPIDLIFLDIEMPQMSGFDFMDEHDYKSQVIVISGNEKYALSTFDYDITDYLLKPFTYQRFNKAIYKCIDRQIYNNSCKIGNYIFIKQNKEYRRILIEQITYIDFIDNEICVETQSASYIIPKNTNIDPLVTHDIFVRINSSSVLNTSYIIEYTDKEVTFLSAGLTKKIILEEEFKLNAIKKFKLKNKKLNTL